MLFDVEQAFHDEVEKTIGLFFFKCHSKFVTETTIKEWLWRLNPNQNISLHKKGDFRAYTSNGNNKKRMKSFISIFNWLYSSWQLSYDNQSAVLTTKSMGEILEIM